MADNRQLAYRWGFRPTSKRLPEWAIRQVAMHGDPDRRATNVDPARSKLPLRRGQRAFFKRGKPGRPRRQVPVELAKELVAQGIPFKRVARQRKVPETTLRGALKDVEKTYD